MSLEVEEFLEHFGVKGMQWGVRRDARGGVSRKTDKEARKDATESARAKMYYGQGAGTRRKLINSSVEAKKKRDADYGRAFERHLANQDMSSHASGARSERLRTDRRGRNRQRAGAVARRATGEMGTQAAVVAVIAGGAAFASSARGQQMMRDTVTRVQNVANEAQRRRGAAAINNLLRNMR